MSSSNNPYLTIIVASRNDDHGGAMLRRLHVFVENLFAQIQQFSLNCELIIVEWNPPENKPALSEVIQWPRRPRSCTVRIVTVPAEIHYIYEHADKLHFFQMIAKNVGIRRARGDFVLATNMDILFSNDLIEFLSRRRLSKEKIYRTDRWDVTSRVLDISGLTERMNFCQQNIIRVSVRNGTLCSMSDVASYLRSLTDDEIASALRDAGCGLMGNNRTPVVSRLSYVAALMLELAEMAKNLPKKEIPQKQEGSLEETQEDGRRARLKKALQHFIKETLLRRLVYLIFHPLVALRKVIGKVVRTPSVNVENAAPSRGDMVGRLHTNGCGDFTLMSKDLWHKIYGYPELEIYSFYLDSIGLASAYLAGGEEEVLKYPLRIFHIEHSSGWTPESNLELYRRMEKQGIPMMSYELYQEKLKELNTDSRRLGEENWGLRKIDLKEWILK